MNLNDLAKTVHIANIKWWQDIKTGAPLKRNFYELLALAVSEISEALEGERKDIMDDKLPHRKMAEVEMADAYIRLLDFSAGFDIPIMGYSAVADLIPDNKGEALFEIMTLITNIDRDAFSSHHYLSASLARIEAYCLKHGYDLWGAFSEKMAFNATREDHQYEARRIAGGKQF